MDDLHKVIEHAKLGAKMSFISPFLAFIQIAVSALLVVAILLQRNAAALGGTFGADNWSSAFHTRRGFEKVLFNATIILAVLFVALALASLIA